MHHLKLASAVKKYSGMQLPIEELRAAITADEKNYSPEEVEEILGAVEVPGPSPSQKTIDPSKPNESLDLSAFDYKRLGGEEFKKYQDFVDTLMLDNHYDFVLHKASPIVSERYPGIPNSPKDFTGITIKNDTPEHTTRITVRDAKNYNSQILNDHGRVNGKFYLLKK